MFGHILIKNKQSLITNLFNLSLRFRRLIFSYDILNIHSLTKSIQIKNRAKYTVTDKR